RSLASEEGRVDGGYANDLIDPVHEVPALLDPVWRLHCLLEFLVPLTDEVVVLDLLWQLVSEDSFDRRSRDHVAGREAEHCLAEGERLSAGMEHPIPHRCEEIGQHMPAVYSRIHFIEQNERQLPVEVGGLHPLEHPEQVVGRTEGSDIEFLEDNLGLGGNSL